MIKSLLVFLDKMNKGISFLKRVFDKKIDTVTIFITSKCNSRCIHCFYWKSLNLTNDLNFNEIKRISKSIGKFTNLDFSGGEPFLVNDLPKISKLFYDQNKIESVSIPTNGLLPDKIIKITEKILKILPKSVNVEVNCSLDGFKKTHDYIRGIKGNFEKSIETINKLEKLKKKYSNFYVTANTTISNKNYKELKEFIEFVKTLNVDNHSFDLIRGDHKGILTLPPLKEIGKILQVCFEAKRHYHKSKGFLERFFYLARIKYIYYTQLQVLKNKKWAFQCKANKSTIVIDTDGGIRLCELLPRVGESRNSNYNIKEILSSKIANKQRKTIKCHDCDCTHICFMINSINHSPFILFFKMPIYYFFGRLDKE